MVVVTLPKLKGDFYFVETDAGTFSIRAELVAKAGCKEGDQVDVYLGSNDEISRVVRHSGGIEGPLQRSK